MHICVIIYFSISFKQFLKMPVQLNTKQLMNESRNITKVQKVKNSTYVLTYCPKKTKSIYKNYNYNLKLIISNDFPQTPPQIYFIQPPYHLNIDQKTGLVRLQILEDNWFQFISVSAIISQIDQILEQPQQSYSMSDRMKKQYKQNANAYFQKVKDSLKNRTINSKTKQQSFEIIGAMSIEKQVTKIKFNTSDIQSLQNALDIKHSDEKERVNKQKNQKSTKLRSIPSLQQSIKTNSKDLTKSKAFSKGKLMKLRSLYLNKGQSPIVMEEESNEIEKISQWHKPEKSQFEQFDRDDEYHNRNEHKIRKPSQLLKRVPQIKDQDQLMKSQQWVNSQEELKKKLDQINKYIGAFMYECKCVQQKLSKSQNSKFKKILQRKIDQQAQFIEQLQKAAMKIKKGIIRRLASEIHSSI